MKTSATTYFELTAGGADDPDGLKAGTVLSAYLHAEEMRVFRRLLWRREAILAAGWAALSLTPLLSWVAILTGFGLLAAAAFAAAYVEWNADRHLKALIEDLPQGSRGCAT